MEIRESDDGKVVAKRIIIEEVSDAHKSEMGSATVLNENKSTPDSAFASVNMLVSCMVAKDGKSFARVSFLRGNDWAEGIVPDAVIEKSEGFTKDEITQLQEYLSGQKDAILKQAKSVNPIKNMFF